MRVVFRVDASETVGAGHLVRCLVLADLIADFGGVSYFLLRDRNVVTDRLLHNSTHEVRYLNLPESSSVWDDAQTSAQWMPGAIDWVVVDHYGLDFRWEATVRGCAKSLLAIDDLANRPHDCDLLVDPGLGRQISDYAGLMRRRSEMLLGTRYAMLKPAFSDYHNAAPIWPAVCRGHVFFGGGSPAAWLPAYVKAMLDAVPALSVSSVGFADEDAMAQLIEIYGSRLKWSRYVEEMAREYSQCDIAIGSPGTATWERACVGLPSGLIATANNQIPILLDLERQGFCRYLGVAWAFDESKFVALFKDFLQDRASLGAMRSLGVSSVDGNGAQRIVQKLFSEGICDV